MMPLHVYMGPPVHVAVQLASGPTTVPVRTDPASLAGPPAGSSLMTDRRRQTSWVPHNALDQ
jgi:hypothetical protein